MAAGYEPMLLTFQEENPCLSPNQKCNEGWLKTGTATRGLVGECVGGNEEAFCNFLLLMLSSLRSNCQGMMD